MLPDFLKRSKLAHRYIKEVRYAGRVINGPFKGMFYEGNSVCSASDPKFLGTYEIELAPLLLKWSKIPFKTIIDIGAAEGYYAVGLSLLFPQAQVIAFESNELGKSLIRQLAESNKVASRVSIDGHCDLKKLQAITYNKAPLLLVIDIEGGERELLNPEETPSLQHAHIIVELHDCFDPGVGELIKDRLSSSHHIQEIWTRDRYLRDFPEPKNALFRRFIFSYLKKYSSEHRPEAMRWFVCTPKVKIEDEGRSS